MKNSTIKIINDILRENRLEYLHDEIVEAVENSVSKIKSGGKVVVCGNGGSAADSAHIVGELLKSFVLPRKLKASDKRKFQKAGKDGTILAEKLQYGIPAIALSGTEPISTAVINDNGAEMMFAQQAFGLLNDKDVFIGISTSGNAENVRLAMKVAKIIGAYSIALSGKTGGALKEIADLNLTVKSDTTYKIQEKHLPIYHLYCMCLENEFFGE
ncbi:MAG: SIS domain-containing protein [Clostridia bacterium]|nr:SIS domain-containing protein [Clostridia bacterium]